MYIYHFVSKKIKQLIFLACLMMGFTAFSPAYSDDQLPDLNPPQIIKLGVIDGPESEIWKVAQQIAAQHGLTIQLVYFSDYNALNDALSSGALDANSFQHKPYLDEQVATRGYQLSIVGDTLAYPIGAYSRKIKNIAELKNGASIGIPNDPTNETRALNLLVSLGLIQINHPQNVNATVLDIKQNNKNLKIHEIDSGVLARMISDFDIIIVNTTWALPAGLDPQHDAIAWETAKDNPYTNVIVTKTKDKDQPWVKVLVGSYHSDAVRLKIKQIFGPTAVFSW